MIGLPTCFFICSAMRNFCKNISVFLHNNRGKRTRMRYSLLKKKILFVEAERERNLPMKILITTDTYLPSINGVVTSVNMLYQELKVRGHDVRILTLSDDIHMKKQEDVYYLRSFRMYVYPGVRGTVPIEKTFRKEIERWRPDIIHTQTEFFTMVIAKKIASVLNIPIVHTYHTMYEHYTRYLLRVDAISRQSAKLFSRESLRLVDAVIAPTGKVEKTLRDYGIDLPVYVIPTGLSMDKFRKPVSEEEKKALRQKLGISKDKKIMATIGRIGLEKNLDEMADHFLHVVRSHPEIVWLIVGDGPYREELQNRILRLRLYDNVIFTGMVAPEEIYLYYKLADVFVSASMSETQGLTYVEALMAGTPLICKKDACLADILEEGLNGYYFENGDEFSEHLSELLNDEEKRKRFSEYALESSVKFSKERFAEHVEEAYLDCLKRFSGREERFLRSRRLGKMKKLPHLYMEKISDYFRF